MNNLNEDMSVEETLKQTRNRLLSSISESMNEEEGIFSKIDSYINESKRIESPNISLSSNISSLSNERSYGNENSTRTKSDACQSRRENCSKQVLQGYNYCYNHILEDANSPFQRCCYISSPNKQCTNPAPKQEKKLSFCVVHLKEEVRNKARKKKRKASDVSSQKKRPSSLAINPDSPLSKHFKHDSSSGDEDYSFFTDTVHLKKTECIWLGNQASDADSTDSEDENPLNHAGTWTLEEALQIYKEKLVRLRHLYSQQYKHLHHHLNEEYRKFASNHDTDPLTLARVPFYQHSGDAYNDYMENVFLTNYQKSGPEEIAAEKALKEKRTRGITLSGKRNDVPKCCSSSDGVRCSKRALPLSKFCFNHILQDPDQYLYAPCMPTNGSCTEPADIINATCKQHIKLLPRTTKKSWDNYVASKKARETRKKKAVNEIDKESLKPTRTSARLSIIKQNKSSDDATANSQTLTTHKSPSVTMKSTTNSLKETSPKKNISSLSEIKPQEFTLLIKKEPIEKKDNITVDGKTQSHKLQKSQLNIEVTSDKSGASIIPQDISDGNQDIYATKPVGSSNTDEHQIHTNSNSNLIKLSEFVSVQEIGKNNEDVATETDLAEGDFSRKTVNEVCTSVNESDI